MPGAEEVAGALPELAAPVPALSPGRGRRRFWRFTSGSMLEEDPGGRLGIAPFLRGSTRGTTMRRAMALAAAGAVIGLGAGAAVPAMGATTDLRFFTVSQGETQTAHGFIIVEKVLQDGKKVGTDRLVCTFRGHKADCKITVKLTGRGNLRLTATFGENSNHGPLKIVGGTAAYAGASGDGNYRNVTSNKTKVLLHVTTPDAAAAPPAVPYP